MTRATTPLIAFLVLLLAAAPTADAKKKRKKKKKKKKDEQAEKQRDRDGWKAGRRTAEDSPEAQEIEVVYAVRRTKARKRPSKTSKKSFRTRVDERLHIIARKEGTSWIRVRNSRGEVGWIKESAVERSDGDHLDGTRDDDDDVAMVDLDDPAIASVDAGPSQARLSLEKRGLELEASAGVGVSSYSRRFSSNGESALGGYTISAPAMTAAAGVIARQHIGDLFVAAHGEFATNVGAPGIRFQQEDGGMSQAQRFQVHQLGAKFEAGATLGDSFPVRIGTSLGYAIDYFLVESVQDNPGLIAQEKLAGVNLGLLVRAGVTDSVLLSAHFEWSPSVTLDQTVNLEDGTESSVDAIAGGLRASYLLDASTTIDLGYAGRRVQYEFSGQSTRQFDVTEARRKDKQHTFMLGVARSL